jgi:hypothetical protein
VALTAAVAVIAVIFAVSVQREVGVWEQAADLRDRVLADARAAINQGVCKRPVFTGVPDSIDGAYVFRNGFPEALSPALSPALGPAQGDCAFSWTDGRFTRSR